MFTRDKSDRTVKLAVASILILLTGLFYGKTYLVLREQARSIGGKKFTYSSGKIELSSVKNIPVENDFCGYNEGHICEGDFSQNIYAVIKCGKVQTNEFDKSQYEQYQERTAGRQTEHILDEHIRNGIDGIFLHQENTVENPDKLSQNAGERANIGEQRKKFNGLNETINRISKYVSSQNTYEKRFQNSVLNTAKKEKFLTTIMLITFIAVVTVFPSTIYLQFRYVLRSETHRILRLVFLPILCLNFAVNPFVYCWRLINYRKTFKVVYCCKC